MPGIKLRYTQPDLKRSYKVPGGKMGMWLIAGVGFLAVAFSSIVTFFHLRSCRSVVLPFIRG